MCHTESYHSKLDGIWFSKLCSRPLKKEENSWSRYIWGIWFPNQESFMSIVILHLTIYFWLLLQRTKNYRECVILNCSSWYYSKVSTVSNISREGNLEISWLKLLHSQRPENFSPPRKSVRSIMTKECQETWWDLLLYCAVFLTQKPTIKKKISVKKYLNKLV